MKMSNRRGFTLAETLVTITVIAVMAAVVVPAVTQYVNKGNTPSSQGDLEQVRSAVTGYVADTHNYPTSMYDLVSLPSNVTGWHGPYFSGNLSTTATSTAGYTSATYRIKLGPTFSTTANAGYLTLTASAGSCQDIFDYDTAIDGSSSQTAGNVTWTGGCATATATDFGSTTVSIKLMPVGT